MVEIKIKSSVPREERTKLYKHALNVFFIMFFVFILVIFLKPKTASKPEFIIKECPELSCDECPGKVVYQNITKETTKYVCEDGTIVDNSQDCKKPEEQLPELKPILTNENGTLIKEVRVEPACVGGYRGGYIYYHVVAPAENVSYQIKTEDGDYEDILKEDGLIKSYKYFVICAPSCPKRGDFSLDYNKRYLLRIEFDRRELYDRIEYSNEYVIDLTPGSEYMTKGC